MKKQMRLVFRPNSKDENAAYSALLHRIGLWWDSFSKKSNEIKGLFKREANFDLPQWMEDELGAVADNLFWEYGPAVNSAGHRLVITPEANHSLRPLVSLIIDEAPAIEDWEFYGYRLAEEPENAISFVEQRTGIDISSWQVQVGKGSGNQISLTYIGPSPDLEPAFITTETLLGEKVLNEWIGSIDAQPLLTAEEECFIVPITELQGKVKELINEIRQSVPKEPFVQRLSSLQWATFQCEPASLPDYVKQRDLVIGISADIDLYSACNGPMLFSSERFSQSGELFTYLQVNDVTPIGEAKLDKKRKIEDKLGEALYESGMGCVIGSGTGIENIYIDLALVNPQKAIPVICKTLVELKAPISSWLRFYDASLGNEWVGMYDETPHPIDSL